MWSKYYCTQFLSPVQELIWRLFHMRYCISTLVLDTLFWCAVIRLRALLTLHSSVTQHIRMKICCSSTIVTRSPPRTHARTLPTQTCPVILQTLRPPRGQPGPRPGVLGADGAKRSLGRLRDSTSVSVSWFKGFTAQSLMPASIFHMRRLFLIHSFRMRFHKRQRALALHSFVTLTYYE
jgi:hypothetical protein